MSSLVTAVMASHNAEVTVLEAVRSVLDQAIDRIQLIVVDDASTDGTRSLLTNTGDIRLELIESADNVGPGLARDRGIAAATGHWIALIDADDTWHRNRLQRLLAAAERSNADVVFDDTMLCHDTPAGLVRWKPLHGTDAFGGRGTVPREVKVEDYISSDRLLIHPLIRTDLIRNHGIQHSGRRFAEDAEFYLRLAHVGARFLYLPEPLYNYRISPGSLTAKAKDPALMRYCLEECAEWQGWSAAEMRAFRRKTAALRERELLYALASDVRGGRLLAATRAIMLNPRLLLSLPHNALEQLRYQAHRTRHGGRRR